MPTHCELVVLITASSGVVRVADGRSCGRGGGAWGVKRRYKLLWPRQARLAGGGIMFSTCPSVCSFVCLLPNLWTRCFENEWNDFDANWRKWSAGRGCETVNFRGRKLTSQSHTRPKIDFEAWHHSRLPWVEQIFQFLHNYLPIWIEFFPLACMWFGDLHILSAIFNDLKRSLSRI